MAFSKCLDNSRARVFAACPPGLQAAMLTRASRAMLKTLALPLRIFKSGLSEKNVRSCALGDDPIQRPDCHSDSHRNCIDFNMKSKIRRPKGHGSGHANPSLPYLMTASGKSPVRAGCPVRGDLGQPLHYQPTSRAGWPTLPLRCICLTNQCTTHGTCLFPARGCIATRT